MPILAQRKEIRDLGAGGKFFGRSLAILFGDTEVVVLNVVFAGPKIVIEKLGQFFWRVLRRIQEQQEHENT